MPRASPLPLLGLLALHGRSTLPRVAAVASDSAGPSLSGPLPPNPPYLFAVGLWQHSDLGASFAVGWQGERGSDPREYWTRRLDIVVDAGPGTADGAATVSNVQLLFKENGSAIIAAFWTPPVPPLPPRAGAASAAAAAAGAGGACAMGGTLPVAWEAIDWDWLAVGGEGDVNWLGLENVTLDSGGVVTADHWQSASACRNIWLVPLENPFDPRPDFAFTVPVRYTLADAADPSCNSSQRLYEYGPTTLLADADGAQSGAYFALPAACTAGGGSGGGSGGGGGGNNTDGGIGVTWLIVGCAFCTLASIIVGIILGRRQVFAQLQQTTKKMHGVLSANLLDGV